jgi:hypothetical protein
VSTEGAASVAPKTASPPPLDCTAAAVGIQDDKFDGTMCTLQEVGESAVSYYCSGLNDVTDCGACGNKCNGGTTCLPTPGGDPSYTCVCPDELAFGQTAGQRYAVCATPHPTIVGALLNNCVDLQHDPNHCGLCGNHCATGICTDGVCELNCPANLPSRCDPCTDNQTDPKNCGDCHVACAGEAACMGGICVCTPAVYDNPDNCGCYQCPKGQSCRRNPLPRCVTG